MTGTVKTILRDLGLVLHIPGGMALISLGVAYWFGEHYAIWPFLATAVLSIGVGQGLYRSFRGTAQARLPHALVTAALAWAIVPLVGTLPYLLISSRLASLSQAPPTVLAFQTIWNALFEAFSGFTSTGLSMAARPSELPHVLQWWRSFSEWIGGVGVIVLMLTILDPHMDAYRLYRSEGREKRILPSLRATVRTIWWIYLAYTVLAILLLRLVDIPWWEAINHGLTAISTGGFSITDSSAGAYEPLAKLVLAFIMLLGAISFVTHYRVLRRREWLKPWQDRQPRALLILLVLGTAVLMIENRWDSGALLPLDSLFQWISASGTAGFSTVNLAGWSPAAQLWLTLAMVIGGAAGSTVGGVKLERAIMIYRGLRWNFKRITSQPHELISYTVGNETLSETEASRRVEAAGVLVAIWVLTLLAGTVIMLHIVPAYYTLSEVIFEVASALSSVGLSVGIANPDLPWMGKLTLIMLMWMGRLEIIPVLILLSWPIGRLRHLSELAFSSGRST